MAKKRFSIQRFRTSLREVIYDFHPMKDQPFKSARENPPRYFLERAIEELLIARDSQIDIRTEITHMVTAVRLLLIYLFKLKERNEAVQAED